jgi:glycosyltransferase involved in cell wall biosynthesis
VSASHSVSVIVAVRNGEAFIGEALRSVVSQLEPPDEIIVVDDASTDGTDAVVRSVAPQARRLASEGSGVSAARNTGLRAARGSLIAFLDHDDLWPAGGHCALRALLAANPDADAAVGRLCIRVESGGAADSLAGLDGEHAPSILMSCLYRRELIDRAGLFDEALRYGEDFDFYLRLVDAGMRPVFCDSAALIYRRHARNATNTAPPQRITLMRVLARRAQRHRAAHGSVSPKIPA